MILGNETVKNDRNCNGSGTVVLFFFEARYGEIVWGVLRAKTSKINPNQIRNDVRHADNAR